MLYDLGFPDWSHGIPKTPSKMLQTMFNFRSPYKIISYYTVELIASELINEFQKKSLIKMLSVIRFGENSSLWQNLKSLWLLFERKNVTLIVRFFYDIG